MDTAAGSGVRASSEKPASTTGSMPSGNRFVRAHGLVRDLALGRNLDPPGGCALCAFLNDWEGEITGKPAPGSKFTQLKIGMSAAQVLSLLGQPSDQGAHPTGKAWIPFYFGSDRYRYEVVYKGQGRLLFASGAGFGWDANTHLIWIIHSAAEQGFR